MLRFLVGPVVILLALVVAPAGAAADVPSTSSADPTRDWPVHFDPAPPRAVPVAAVPSEGEADQAWALKIRRHRREGAYGFIGTYGAAALTGGAFAGVIGSSERTSAFGDNRKLLYGVALPLFAPVVGPLFVGSAVGITFTGLLLETHGEFAAFGIMLAPFAYGFATLAIADGVMQAAFLRQAFGGADPQPPAWAAYRSRLGPLAALTPMPMVVNDTRGMPAGVGLQLPGTW